MNCVNKYKNRKTKVDNIVFASAKESRRYLELKLLQKAGEISDLRLQTRLPIVVNGKKVCDYLCDFSYMENGKFVFEDVKGVRTALYQLKKKLVKAVHNIDLLET